MSLDPRGAVVTVGVFDGVHLGHQVLVRQMVDYAVEHALDSVCITFDPDPSEVLQPEETHLALLSLDERVARLRALGSVHVEVVPFSEAFSNQSADEFIDWVRHMFELRALWVGTGFALGHGREGTVERLQEIGRRCGFLVHVLEPVEHEGQRISSTWIRELLVQGDVLLATKLLGGPYCVAGHVVSGARRGREIGFPTANLVPPPGRVLPADGVYLVRAELKGRSAGSEERGDPEVFHGVVNLGGRPTFGEAEPLIETHLLDFSGDIYGAAMEVCFLQKLRGVRRFDSVDDLRDQIGRDVAAARELL